jgi:CBS domain-containing protein
MDCPFCGAENISGSDECEHCGEDLTAFDNVHPKDRLEKSLIKDAIETIRLEPLATVESRSSVREAAEKLAQSNRCVLVMDGEQLVGIVTERDILFRFMGTGKDPEQTPVADIMTPKPETLEPSDKLAIVLNKMAIGGYRHVPIMRGGRAIGAVSVRDILGYLAEMFPKAVHPPQAGTH